MFALERLILQTVLVLVLSFVTPKLWAVSFNSYGVTGYDEYIEAIKSALGSDLSNTDVVITFGLPALHHQLTLDNNSPILSLFVTSNAFQQTLINIPSSRRVSAIYSDPNPLYMIYLTRALYKPSRILLASTSETFTKLPILNSPNVHNLLLKAGDTRSLIAATDQYDVLIALPDKTLYNATTIQPIVSSLYRRKKFIVGYSKSMVESGALAAVTTDTNDLIDSVKFTLEVYKKEKSLPPPSHPNEFTIAVNRKLAMSLEIYTQDDRTIHQQILDMVGENE